MGTTKDLLAIVREDFLPELVRQGYAETNIGNYETSLVGLIQHARWRTCSDMRQTDIEKWLETLCSAKTQNNRLGHVRTFCGYLRDRRFIHIDPSEKARGARLKNPGKGSRAFTPEEFHALIQSVEEHSSGRGDHRYTDRRKLVYRLLATTGLRRREAMLLQWDMVGHLLIDLPGTVAKAQHAQSLPLGAEALGVLKELRKYRLKDDGTGRPDLVIWWGLPCHHTLREDCDRAKIPRRTSAGRIGLHSFRKFFLTQAARVASPAVLKALGRHADIKTTMQSYVNLEHLEARGVLDTLRLLSNPDRRGPIGPTPGREASRGTPSGYPNDPESDGEIRALRG